MKIRPSRLSVLLFLATVSRSLFAQTPQVLSLHDAEQIAVQNHPQVQAAQNMAEAAKQQVREVRSSYYPTAFGSLTGVEAENNSRITAGGLNNPIILDRYANGVSVSQLVTDFGRTHELSKSSGLHAQALEQNVSRSRAEVLVQVDEAYFAALKAQAVLQVAEQTVQQRQVVADQITALASNQLKSDLDVSFAQVDLSQGQLLLIQAQNNLQASFSDLSAALGYPDERTFTLVEEPVPGPPPSDLQQMINEAFQNRPELLAERLNVESASSYATAERDLFLPTISAGGVAGLTPFRQAGLDSRYAAAGFNVNIPIFNGHLFSARLAEAKYRAQAEGQYLRDLQDRIARDVRTTWLSANSSFQRLSVTAQFLNQATQALNLAQARYQLGLSSIVELTQAQLNLTQAQIEQANAKYDYQVQLQVLKYQNGSLR
jgi:outer membrane protein